MLLASTSGREPDAAHLAELRATVAPLGWAIVEPPTADDTRAAVLRAVVDRWPVADGAVVTAAELVEHASRDAGWGKALLAWCGRDGALPTVKVLGYALRSLRGEIIGRHRIDAAKPGEHGRPWVRLRIG